MIAVLLPAHRYGMRGCDSDVGVQGKAAFMSPLAHRVPVFRRKQRAPPEQTKYPFPDLGLCLRDGFRRYGRLVKPQRFIVDTEHAIDDAAVEVDGLTPNDTMPKCSLAAGEGSRSAVSRRLPGAPLEPDCSDNLIYPHRLRLQPAAGRPGVWNRRHKLRDATLPGGWRNNGGDESAA
jgi:hypothetical protein